MILYLSMQKFLSVGDKNSLHNKSKAVIFSEWKTIKLR